MRYYPSKNVVLQLATWALLIFGFIFFPAANAQFNTAPALTFSSPTFPKALPLEEAFKLTLSNEQNRLITQWYIASGNYLYQRSLKINLFDSAGNQTELLKPALLPEAQSVEDLEFGSQKIYRLQLNISLTLPANAFTEKSLFLQIDYQGCSETAHFCYPPVSKWFKVQTNDHVIEALLPLSEAPDFSQRLSDMAHQFMPEVPDLTQKNRSFLLDIITFYFLGILLTFTPCVLPMIPILFGIIVGQKHLNTRRAFWLSLSYVLSMAFTYALAGIVAATLGKNLQAYLQQPLIITLFALLLIYLGLSQLNVIRLNLPPPLRLKEWLNRLHARQESGTYVGAAVMGILATLISSPCVTLPLIGALSYISQSGNIMLGASALLALGLGMGTILLLMGTLGGKYLPKSGAWTYTVNHLFAAMMFGLGLWLLDRVFHGPWILVLWAIWCLFIAWSLGAFQTRATWQGRLGVLFIVYAAILSWGAWQGETDPLKPFTYNPWKGSLSSDATPLNFQIVTSLKELDKIQHQASEQATPLLVAFYADWCMACQHMESVLSDPQIQSALKAWQLVRVDVTSFDEESQLALKRFSLIGPPALLFFNRQGEEIQALRIIGETSLSSLLAQISKAEG